MTVGNAVNSKAKGVLGSPPGFPTHEHLIVSPMADLDHSSMSLRGVMMETERSSFRVDCPHFDGEHFRG